MKHFIILFAGLLLPLVQRTTASPAPQLKRRYGDLVVHEKRAFNDELDARGEPSLRRRVESHVTIPLRIALKQGNLDALPGHLLSVSDPSSSSYGQHWTHERIVEAFAPSPKAHETVLSWLVDVGGFEASRVSVSKNGGWVEVVGGATIAEAEGLLRAEYHVFARDDGADVVGCQNYSLPAQVAEHVDFVVPTVQPNIKLVKSANEQGSLSRRNPPLQARAGSAIPSGSLAGCDTAVVPSCLKTLYNMGYTPKATNRNTFGIVSHFPLTYLQSDLDTFFRNFSPSLVGKSPTLVSINGGGVEVGPTSDVGEDGWILQYAMTLVEPQPVQLLQSGNAQTSLGDITDVSFNEWLDAIDGSYCTSQGGDDFTYDPQLPNPFPGGLADHSCGTIPNTTRPHVVSNSQAAHEYFFSEFYLERQCNEFAKLGLMGVSVLYSAGNTGVAGVRGYCLDDNGSLNLNGTNFTPNWPASCPWVTVVGGTQVKSSAATSNSSSTPSAGSHPEEVWNQDLTSGFFESSGGGFSNRFSSPAYQRSAVQGYLRALGNDGKGKFNVKGRAYPDLSANANMFVNIDNGAISIDSGTSGATPTVASIITLVNDARISAGKKPVGFINPTIYSPAFADAFNDIIDGTSQGCKGLQGDRGGGFIATKGWDAATGLGTPNLGVLIEKWLALP